MVLIMKTENLENIVEWARGKNSLITYAQLNDELHENMRRISGKAGLS
jgi:hypothetical protein